MPIPEWLVRCANKPGHYEEGGPEGTKAVVIKGKRLPHDFDRPYVMEEFPTVTIWREMRGRWQLVVSRLGRVPKDEMQTQIALGNCSKIAVIFHPKFEEITDIAEEPPKELHANRKCERKDYWKQDENSWIRVHVKPRRSMFTPCGTKNGPDIEALSLERTTQMKISGEADKRIEDYWTNKEEARKIQPEKWTYFFQEDWKIEDS